MFHPESNRPDPEVPIRLTRPDPTGPFWDNFDKKGWIFLFPLKNRVLTQKKSVNFTNFSHRNNRKNIGKNKQIMLRNYCFNHSYTDSTNRPGWPDRLDRPTGPFWDNVDKKCWIFLFPLKNRVLTQKNGIKFTNFHNRNYSKNIEKKCWIMLRN